ncbi:MAG TPA: hypothetical protein VHE79_14465 [Spirochaetia bacterium]
MKYISQVGINLTRRGVRPPPGRVIAYMCLVWTDDAQPIDEELDAAIETVEGVTWTAEDAGSTWEGAIYGRDPESVESARQFLIDGKGWRSENVGEGDAGD